MHHGMRRAVAGSRAEYEYPRTNLIHETRDGSLIDTSTGGNNLSNTNGTLTTNQRGESNSAWALNGTTAYLSLGNVLNIGTSDRTTVLWVKIPAIGTLGAIMSKVTSGFPSHILFMLADGSLNPQIAFDVSSKQNALSNETGYDNGNWCCLILKHDRSEDTPTLKFYDALGNLTTLTWTVPAYDVVSGDVSTSADFMFGRRDNGATPFYLPITIGDKVIYDIITSDAQDTAMVEGTKP